MVDQSSGPARPTITRRDFIKATGLAGGGLLVGVYLVGCGNESPEPPPSATSSPSPRESDAPELAWVEPSVFLKIGTDDTVTITVHKSEMGQGVRTALPMIVAEELEADWATIRVEQAPADRAYGNQVTGGSTSVSESYALLRRAGATARELLIAAAAQVWGVDAEACHANKGTVVHGPSGRALTFGQLVETASTMDIPPGSDVPLKDPADFRLIGTSVGRVDDPPIVAGSAVYGLDVRIPGMLFAVVARPPTLGGRLDSFDSAGAEAVSGVRRVVQIDNGVAVVAENTWAAIQGRNALEVAWSGGGDPELSTPTIRERLGARARDDSVAEEGARVLEAFYEVPYFAHATMEPMNCAADVRADRCEIWAPTQAPRDAQLRAQSITDLPLDAIEVHVTLIGGGFGRRLQVDYVTEAVQVSKAVGAPVQVVWTREDDIRSDFFHPFSYHRARGSLDQPTLPEIRTYASPSSVPTGAWRSVGNVPDAFVRESFLDEMAAALERDPYELRRELEPEALLDVLDVAATKSGWGTPLPPGQGRGIACHATWDASSVAQVAEVSVETDGRVRVRRVVCAVDCGVVINPDMVVAQMEGGIVFGLTAALKGEGITLEKGQVQQGNFHDYPLLRYDEMPQIEVHLVRSERRPSGVGEMGTPPIIPAVANAIFAATGKRIRRIPVLPGDLLGA